MNCLILDDEPIAQDILKEYISKVDYLNLEGCFSNSSEAFNHLQKVQPDLIFLDINMPGIDGVSFAKIIPKEIQVVFTTAYREYALEGFDLQASDYLLKPISFDRFLKSVSRVKALHDKMSASMPTTSQDFVFVRIERKMEKIALAEITYIESFADYLKIHQKTQTSVVRESLSSFEKKLPPSQFIRIHRSFIANLNAITSYTHEYLEVVGKALTISRSYKEEVIKRLREFE
ncbi:LytR/AlgR family response regulator transcription factor [Algoriphagus namhaensis]|uniref:LytR/AlgR family response regulator transcription factor n=1 Tax=Algoriphagus namhaensis TaxID=915353 RepID=A0ABV8AW57_9BACT